MLADRQISIASELLSTVWTAEGELTNLSNKKLRYFVAAPLNSSSCEVGFEGTRSEAYFERITEALSKLPSHHEFQIVLERRLDSSGEDESLFPAFGLETKIHLIESGDSTKVSGVSELFEDLGMEFKKGGREEYLSLVRRFFGQQDCDEQLILPDLAWEEDHTKSGKSHIKATSLTDLPLTTWNNLLEHLAQNSDEFLLSLKVGMPDKAKSKKELETKRRVSHALSAKKAHELSDLESGSNLSASEEILVRVTQGKEALLNMSLAIFMSDEDLKRLEERIHGITSDANGSTGAGFYVETIGTLPVLRGHLPGGKALSSRELPMLTGNLAQFMPLFLDYSRHQEASKLKFVSRCGEVSHLNLFSSNNLNFNAFVCGASGSGKSFLMNSILAGFSQDFEKPSVAIFDVGGSYRKLVRNLNGAEFDLDAESAVRLIATAFKRTKIQANGFCKTLLENICGSGAHITHSHRVALEELLQSCADAPFSLRLLSSEAAERKERVYEDIVLWLRPYLHWDHVETDGLVDEVLDKPIRAFDFKNLEGDPLLQKLTILILTHGIWERLKKDCSGPTIIVFDEVWKFFSQASGFLEEMYRTFRKYRAGIVSVTQNLSDYGDDAFAKLVITNSFHRILLQGAASSEVLNKTLDMDESDMKRFMSIASKKNEYSEFWLGTPKFSQVYRYYPSKALFELANSENIQKEVMNEAKN